MSIIEITCNAAVSTALILSAQVFGDLCPNRPNPAGWERFYEHYGEDFMYISAAQDAAVRSESVWCGVENYLVLYGETEELIMVVFELHLSKFSHLPRRDALYNFVVHFDKAPDLLPEVVVDQSMGEYRPTFTYTDQPPRDGC